MTRLISFEQRKVRRLLGALHKAVIVTTLGSLFLFAPLRGSLSGPSQVAMAPVTEMPETEGSRKVLWLKPSGLGKGDSFKMAFEE